MIQNEGLLYEYYKINPDNKTLNKLKMWLKLFIEYNSKINLTSKGDMGILYEKHVLDSLSISLFKGFTQAKTVADIGCGGGFPSVILSIFYPDKKIYAIDSILKKINFIEFIKKELELENLRPIRSRIENLPPLNCDILTTRAVGKIADIWKLSKKHLKKEGYFVAYKALLAKDEANEAVKMNPELKIDDFIEYKLPLKENFKRELVILKYC